MRAADGSIGQSETASLTTPDSVGDRPTVLAGIVGNPPTAGLDAAALRETGSVQAPGAGLQDLLA